MLIGALAEAAGLPARTVRFYERRGLLPEPGRAANGYRVYDDATLPRLRFIRSAQAAGLTLSEIRRVIEIRDEGAAPCAHVGALLTDKLDEVRERRGQLETLEREIERLIERGDHLDPADCAADDICQILHTDRTGPPGDPSGEVQIGDQTAPTVPAPEWAPTDGPIS
jgi:DNA-binding transcriptional MerR regulator